MNHDCANCHWEGLKLCWSPDTADPWTGDRKPHLCETVVYCSVFEPSGILGLAKKLLTSGEGN